MRILTTPHSLHLFHNLHVPHAPANDRAQRKTAAASSGSSSLRKLDHHQPVSTPESRRRMHSQRPQGVWRYSARLPSRKNDGSPLPQVPPSLPFSSIPPAERFWDHSLRYHRLHPEYIHQRIERLGQSYNLRVLLLMCDIVRPSHLPFPHPTLSNTIPQSEHQEPIRELTRVCLVNNITVIVAWS